MNDKFIFASNENQQIQETFADFGFVRITGVFNNDEIQILANEVERIKSIATTLPENLVWFSPSTLGAGKYVIQRISRINYFSEAIHNLGQTHDFLHRISATLLGVDHVRCADGYDGSDGAVLVVKDPNNASVHTSLRWHLDSSFTKHLPINPFVNLGIYLDTSGVDKGGLVVAPKSHRLENAFDTKLAETTDYFENEICVPANKGDIVIHSSELWHCSRSHTVQGELRRVIYFNYYKERQVQNAKDRLKV